MMPPTIQAAATIQFSVDLCFRSTAVFEHCNSDKQCRVPVTFANLCTVKPVVPGHLVNKYQGYQLSVGSKVDAGWKFNFSLLSKKPWYCLSRNYWGCGRSDFWMGVLDSSDVGRHTHESCSCMGQPHGHLGEVPWTNLSLCHCLWTCSCVNKTLHMLLKSTHRNEKILLGLKYIFNW